MEKVTGLVLEVREKDCLVLGPGNEYVRLRLPKTLPQVGDIIESYRMEPIHQLANRPVSRIWAYVASILITLVLGGYQVYATNSTPTAYVSLDMAPSIELILNSRGNVIRATSYNPQGVSLLEQVQVEDLPVKDALKDLVYAAADKSSSSSNPVVLTYTATSYLQGEELNQLVVDTLQEHSFRGQLLSQPINLKFREKAASARLSAGEQLVLDLAGENSLTLPADDLVQQSLPQVLQNHGIKLEQLTGYDKQLASPPLLLPISPATPPSSKAPADPNRNNLAQKKVPAEPDRNSKNRSLAATPDSELKQQQKPAAAQAAPTAAKPDLQPVLLSTALDDSQGKPDNGASGETLNSDPGYTAGTLPAPAPSDPGAKSHAKPHPEKKAKQENKTQVDKQSAAPAGGGKPKHDKVSHDNDTGQGSKPNQSFLTFLGSSLS